MQKQIRSVITILLTIIIAAGCTSPTDTPTETSAAPQFGIETKDETVSWEVTIPPDQESSTEESSTEESSTEASSTEESSTEESSTEESETTFEASSEETSSPTDPSETLPEESREVLNFIPVDELVTATASVNVREDYSTDSNILGVLRPGHTLTRIGYHDEWSRVVFEGMECYVASAYLTTETLPPETTEAPTEPPTEPPTTAPAVTAPPYNSSYFNNLSNAIFTGRWFSKDVNGNSRATINAGSEFTFAAVDASYAFVYINGQGQGDFYYAYSVDGQAPVRQHISDPVIPLGDTGTHSVRIIIDSIGDHGKRWDEETVVGVLGIAVDSGTISPWQYSGSLIAFFGDSITDGIRTLSRSGHSYTNSYAYHCSQALGASPIVCGFPGSGATKNGVFNTFANAIDFYSSTRGADFFDPSIIIVNHGTNDISADSPTFTAAYNHALDVLHLKYPNAKIACMIPVSQAHADDIRSCVTGKDWCAVIETSSWSVSYSDGIHPDAACAYSMGTNLANALLSIWP